MTIEEFLVAIGIELDRRDLEDIRRFERELRSATKTLAKLTAVAVGGSAALAGFVAWVSKSVDALGKQARVLDLDAQRLDELRFAMDITTGSAEGMDGALESLSKKISEASRGLGEGVEIFGLLGTEVVDAEGNLRKVDDVLLDVLDKTQELDATQRIEYLDKLGLGNLNLTARDFDTFVKSLKEARSLGFISEEDVNKAEQFNDSITRVWRVVKDLAIMVASTLSPMMKDLVDRTTEWVKVNKEFLRQELTKVFETLGKVFMTVVTIMVRILGLGLKITRMVGGLNNVLKITLFIMGLIAAFAVGKGLLAIIGLVGKLIPLLTLANAKLLLVPTIIGGLIALIVLAIDELATFAKGGRTLFDFLFDKFPTFRILVEDVLANIMIAWDSFIDLVKSPLKWDNWVKFFDGILGLFGTTLESFETKIMAVMKPIRDAMVALGLIDDKTPEMVEAIRTEGAGGGPEMEGRMIRTASRQQLIEARKRIQAANQAGANAAQTVQQSNNTVNKSTTLTSSQKVTVEVKGNTDGMDKQALQEAIEKSVIESNREALRNIETGIQK